MRLNTPLAERSHRLPEQGRIRMGVRGERFPKSLNTFRFTSQDESAIDSLARAYGGQCRPWQNGKIKEYEVLTGAKEVPIALPPDPLGTTPIYELWSKGGLARRCDGETCTVPQWQGEEIEHVESPCICDAKQVAECKVVTRLSVILPDIDFGGTWRLETKSWNAAEEMPGMVELIQSVTGRGQIIRAYLGIRSESKMVAGKGRDFIVPYLRLAHSVTELAAGHGRLSELGRVPAPRALPAPDPDDDVVEGELVEDSEEEDPIGNRVRIIAAGMGVCASDLYAALCLKVDEDVVEAELLPANAYDRIWGAVQKVLAGTHRFRLDSEGAHLEVVTRV